MIKKISDISCFDDEGFNRLANALKQKNGKLFKTTNTEIEAKNIKDNLIHQGYQSNIKMENDHYNVYYSSNLQKVKCDDQTLKNFIQISENKYNAFNKKVLAGIYDYDFNDGSIWKVQNFEDGQYLVKDVNDDNEEKVIRGKTASVDDKNIVNENNIKNCLSAFYDKSINENLYNDILNDVDSKKAIVGMLNKKIIQYVSSVFKEHKLIESKNMNNTINKLLITALNDPKTSSKKIISSIIVEQCSKNTFS